ncbi:MAG: glycosyltransferase [Methylotenera sp.]|uniref:glycosyltransferase n=1 Tax=Methylotenera sp. TaxID=2051956 RepID=UPI0027269E7B|nr:glycosyltransferase [Methylotenera sp.]MDO9150509.1 glycosyltransferase [Methylotenera sp.]
MRNDIIKIFIGYDPVESVAWHTLTHSILRQSSKPVAIVPINLANLNDIYSRTRDAKQSNEFSFTRFLVPYLSDYNGFSIFLDCDMLLRTDINQIFDVINSDPGKAIYVVKHDYTPKNSIKYLNNIQYAYPRKNWSSVVLWNCAHPSNKMITPDYVNTADAISLHRFTWLKDEEIGSLDVNWNWLVGEYENPNKDVKNIHWTVGGPYFKEFDTADFSREWFEEYSRMTFCKQK